MTTDDEPLCRFGLQIVGNLRPRSRITGCEAR